IKLYLPRADVVAADAVAMDGHAAANPGGHETILVVEDSKTVRDVAAGMLRSLGYNILEAEDGHAALAILRQPVAIDLLFTDLIMPGGINGQELLRRAHELHPGLKAMFTSGYSEQFLQDRSSAEMNVPL